MTRRTSRTSKSSKPNVANGDLANERQGERMRDKTGPRPAGHGPVGKSETDKVERPSVLASKFIEFMRRLRQANYSMEKIAAVCMVSKSTVHLHTSDVIPDTTGVNAIVATAVLSTSA